MGNEEIKRIVILSGATSIAGDAAEEKIQKKMIAAAK